MAKTEAAPKGREKKAKKPKTRRFHPIKFIKEVIAELKKVSWPTRKELFAYSLAVLTFVVIAAVVVGVVDTILSQILKLI